MPFINFSLASSIDLFQTIVDLASVEIPFGFYRPLVEMSLKIGMEWVVDGRES